MKRTKILCILLGTVLAMGSCISSNDSETTLYDSAAITAFSLGTLNRYLHTTTSAGADSIYKKTVTGSSYAFHIDQVNHRIYNTDSLPTGTDVAHVLVTLTTANNGLAVIEDMNSDTLRYYVSTDSIDFTRPRTFIVYSSDGSGETEYTVSVNVHQEEGDKFVWTRMNDYGELAQLETIRANASPNMIHVYGKSAVDGQLKIHTLGQAGWTECPSFADADLFKGMIGGAPHNIVLYGTDLEVFQMNMQYVSTLSSELDNIQWLIGGKGDELYALSTDHQLLVTRDKGLTWQPDALDETVDSLPLHDLALVAYPMTMDENTDYLLLAGRREVTEQDADGNDVKVWHSRVWRKIVDNSDYAPQGQWAYMQKDADNDFILPATESLSLLRYDDGVLAIGKPYTQIYQSRDNGITWKQNARYKMPDGFDTSATSVAAVVDEEQNIWLFCAGTGQVWRGQLNRLHWSDTEE